MLLAVAEHLNIQSDLIPRIATGFCSGMAHTGGMCGAVSGGIMSISLALGRSSPSSAVDPCYQAVKQFLSRFTSQYHALTCLELTGVHLGTPEGQAAFREQKLVRQCSDYVSGATAMVVEILPAS